MTDYFVTSDVERAIAICRAVPWLIGVLLALVAVDLWLSRKDEPPHVTRMREEGERRLRGGK